MTAGAGELFLDDQRVVLMPGDTALISPGTVHWVSNTGDTVLRILCACTPAYSLEDIELV